MPDVTYSVCTTGDVRLTGGSNEYEGRVEICTNGAWGSVCDSGWDDTDAYAVCRQLQYSGILYYISDKFTYYIQVVWHFMIPILGLELPLFIYTMLPVVTTLLFYRVVLRLGIHILILLVITTKKQE